jgi:hypothetical protein
MGGASRAHHRIDIRNGLVLSNVWFVGYSDLILFFACPALGRVMTPV